MNLGLQLKRKFFSVISKTFSILNVIQVRANGMTLCKNLLLVLLQCKCKIFFLSKCFFKSSMPMRFLCSSGKTLTTHHYELLVTFCTSNKYLHDWPRFYVNINYIAFLYRPSYYNYIFKSSSYILIASSFPYCQETRPTMKDRSMTRIMYLAVWYQQAVCWQYLLVESIPDIIIFFNFYLLQLLL